MNNKLKNEKIRKTIKSMKIVGTTTVALTKKKVPYFYIYSQK